ncbi:MAG TPA: Amuc_1100 family pilus-like protein [Prosthecobacter sp.]
MDWIRENKSLAGILGVIIAVTAALGYLLFDAWSSYTATKENFGMVTSQVVTLKSAPLAPTEANLQAKKALVEEFATTVNKLGNTLLILQPKVQPIKDIEFQAKLKTKVTDVRKAAASFKMGLPADFAFGFDEYNSNLPKSEAAATELSGYLDAVDELVKLFMNSGVLSLDSLERSKLPVETAGAPPQSQQRNARAGAAQTQAAGAGGVLEKSQISVVLTLDQGPLQLLTGRLTNPSEMPYFTSLRVLRIENQSQEGPPRMASAPAQILETPPTTTSTAPTTPAPGPDGTTPAAAPVSEDILPPPPAPPDSTPLIGQEKLKVRMEIDLVKFLPSAGGAVAQGAPAPQR